MGIGSFAYKFVFLLHIMSAIVGIGAVMLNGIYGAKAKADQGPGGAAISRANFEVSEVAEKVIYTIPLWGLLLVWLSDGVWGFTDLWVLLALAVYVAAVGIATAILVPTHRRLNVLMDEMVAAGPPAGGPPPQAAQAEALGQKLGLFGAINSVLVVVIVVLMIWKPGA